MGWGVEEAIDWNLVRAISTTGFAKSGSRMVTLCCNSAYRWRNGHRTGTVHVLSKSQKTEPTAKSGFSWCPDPESNRDTREGEGF